MPLGAAIVADGVDVATVAHLGRSPSAHQRSALEARGYACEVPGCGATFGLEIDHVGPWVSTRRTVLADLAWLCPAHHADKTHGAGASRASRAIGAGYPPPGGPARAPDPEPALSLFGDPPFR